MVVHQAARHTPGKLHEELQKFFGNSALVYSQIELMDKHQKVLPKESSSVNIVVNSVLNWHYNYSWLWWPYAVYTILITVFTRSGSKLSCTVCKRYSDFRKLAKQLQHVKCDEAPFRRLLQEFPKRNRFSVLRRSVLQGRLSFFQRFLRELTSLDDIPAIKDIVWDFFLSNMFHVKDETMQTPIEFILTQGTEQLEDLLTASDISTGYTTVSATAFHMRTPMKLVLPDSYTRSNAFPKTVSSVTNDSTVDVSRTGGTASDSGAGTATGSPVDYTATDNDDDIDDNVKVLVDYFAVVTVTRHLAPLKCLHCRAMDVAQETAEDGAGQETLENLRRSFLAEVLPAAMTRLTSDADASKRSLRIHTKGSSTDPPVDFDQLTIAKDELVTCESIDEPVSGDSAIESLSEQSMTSTNQSIDESTLESSQHRRVISLDTDAINREVSPRYRFQSESDVDTCQCSRLRDCMAARYDVTKQIYEGCVAARFPETDRPTVAFPTDLPIYCLPAGAKLVSSAESSQQIVFQFVLDAHPHTIFGSCLTVYEPAPYHLKNLFAPKVYVILSRFPAYATFKELLFHAHRIQDESARNKFMRNCVEVPTPRHVESSQQPPIDVLNVDELTRERRRSNSFHQLSFSGTTSFSLTPPRPMPSPASCLNSFVTDSFITCGDLVFKPLFKALSLDIILKLFSVLLTGQSVVLTSRNLELLSQCCEAVCELLYPLSIRGTIFYLPILPRQLLHYCFHRSADFDRTFLVGVPADYFHVFNASAVRVDLDLGQIWYEAHRSPLESFVDDESTTELPDIPTVAIQHSITVTSPRRHTVHHSVESTQDSSCTTHTEITLFQRPQNIKAHAPFTYPVLPDRALNRLKQHLQSQYLLLDARDDQIVRRAFLQFFATIFRHFEHFLLPQQISTGEYDICFYIPKPFFDRHNDTSKPFFKALFATQACDNFINDITARPYADQYKMFREAMQKDGYVEGLYRCNCCSHPNELNVYPGPSASYENRRRSCV
eukprot:GILJ01008318.1.p1 GENE.GILJ01008318.1~~GILJ01008318.1.p1  ORF type:complete len:1003 (+),score=135.44 GILJ01008318.1:94-3102(+)